MSSDKGIASEMVLDLLDPATGVPTPVAALVSYQASAPYALTMAFRVSPNDSVEWVFARDLLADGITRPAGDGDVKVAPSPQRSDCLSLVLSSPTGTASFLLPLRQISKLLARSYVMVPKGQEHEHLSFDIDQEIADLIRRTEWRGV